MFWIRCPLLELSTKPALWEYKLNINAISILKFNTISGNIHATSETAPDVEAELNSSNVILPITSRAIAELEPNLATIVRSIPAI